MFTKLVGGVVLTASLCSLASVGVAQNEPFSYLPTQSLDQKLDANGQLQLFKDGKLLAVKKELDISQRSALYVNNDYAWLINSDGVGGAVNFSYYDGNVWSPLTSYPAPNRVIGADFNPAQQASDNVATKNTNGVLNAYSAYGYQQNIDVIEHGVATTIYNYDVNNTAASNAYPFNGYPYNGGGVCKTGRCLILMAKNPNQFGSAEELALTSVDFGSVNDKPSLGAWTVLKDAGGNFLTNGLGYLTGSSNKPGVFYAMFGRPLSDTSEEDVAYKFTINSDNTITATLLQTFSSYAVSNPSKGEWPANSTFMWASSAPDGHDHLFVMTSDSSGNQELHYSVDDGATWKVTALTAAGFTSSVSYSQDGLLYNWVNEGASLAAYYVDPMSQTPIMQYPKLPNGDTVTEVLSALGDKGKVWAVDGDQVYHFDTFKWQPIANLQVHNPTIVAVKGGNAIVFSHDGTQVQYVDGTNNTAVALQNTAGPINDYARYASLLRQFAGFGQLFGFVSYVGS